MRVNDRVAIVTGGGAGIGAALVAALAAAGARVVAADLDGPAARAVADRADAASPGSVRALGTDVADPARLAELIAFTEREFGPVELFFANAGVTGAPGLGATETEWDQVLDVNLRAHIRAAELLVPGWLERGEGYFVSTASAAGLLTQLGAAGYAVSKHAAVGFAEWLSVTYGDNGIRVSCLCPMAVDTRLLHAGTDSDDPLGRLATRAVTAAGATLTPDRVAELVLEAIDAERFLILPHPEVLEMYRQKAADYDRWLQGMRRYQATLLE